MKAYRRARAYSRKGFTLTETLIVMVIGSVMALAICSLILTTFRTFGQETQQNGVNLRARSLVSTLSADIQSGYEVVYIGTGTYSVPGGGTIPRAGFTGTNTLNVVFQAPAYGVNGIISNTWDYIGFIYDNPADKVYRAVVAATGSSRTSTSAVIPEGGWNDTAFAMTFHIATTAPTTVLARTNYLNTAGQWKDSAFAYGSGSTGSLQDIDAVRVTATVGEPAYLNSSQIIFNNVSVAAKLRNWRQNP